MPQTWIQKCNGATNRWFRERTDRPHYFDVYRRMVDEAVGPAECIIHLGAGAMGLDRIASVPLGDKTVWAVDPDASALERNPNPNRIQAFGESIPLPDAIAQAIICEHVVEHLERPEEVLREAGRLLEPGGRFVFTTPNLWSYSGLATHLTPQWFHDFWIAKLREQSAGRTEAPYPTCYRMNSVSSVQRIAAAAGFDIEELWTGVDYPTYTYPLPVVHQLATAWHYLLDRVDALAPFRITITATLVRQ